MNSWIALFCQRVLPLLSFTGLGSRPSLVQSHMVEREASKYFARDLSEEYPTPFFIRSNSDGVCVFNSEIIIASGLLTEPIKPD